MKNFLSVNDAGNPDDLIQLALQFRREPLSKKQSGAGKRLGLIFLNPSLRTRLSTQVAAQNLGMEVIVFNASQDGWSLEFEEGVVMNGNSVEHIKDAAPILGRYFDILGVRTFPSLKNKEEDYNEKVIGQFVKYADIPVISLESATVHPLQSLTDLITITDHYKEIQTKKPKVVLTWAPHIKPLPQCVPNSFSEWMESWKACEFVIANPQGFDLDKTFTGNAPVVHNQDEALKEADFVYVKNWSSYQNYGATNNNAEDWMITPQKLSVTNDAKVLHCLPVRRNVEIASEVLDSAASIVTDEAANRVWAAQAVLSTILSDLQ